MNGVALFILLLMTITDPLMIRKINKAKDEAATAYIQGNYSLAIEKYRYLIDSLHVSEDPVFLNLAHAQLMTRDTVSARSGYQSLIESDNDRIRSKSLQQLGVLANRSGNPVEALDLLKRAIKADPNNLDARYNYELLKKKLENKNKEQEQQDQKQDQQNKDNPEPSDYAKRLKEQADRLVAQHRYQEAHSLMVDGLKKDPSVAAYQDYINRIGDVSGIDK